MAKCAICQKMKAKRPCPAKGHPVCSMCCGQKRGPDLGCPPDCAYLGPHNAPAARAVSMAAPSPDGTYLLEEAGIRIAVLSAEDAGGLQVGAFCVDTWQDGLFACQARRFDSAEDLRAEVAASPYAPRAATRHEAQEIVAYGLRIRRETGRSLPPTYATINHLVEPLDEIRLTGSLYRCPSCGDDLSASEIDSILRATAQGMGALILCARCSSRRGPPSERLSVLAPRHANLHAGLAELDELKLTGVEALVKASLEAPWAEAIEMLIRERDVLLAACQAIEAHLYLAAAPNPQVGDRDALAALRATLDERYRSSATSTETDRFLAEALQEGVDYFKSLCRKHTIQGCDEWVHRALTRLEKSVRHHSRRGDPRAYIDYVAQFMP